MDESPFDQVTGFNLPRLNHGVSDCVILIRSQLAHACEQVPAEKWLRSTMTLLNRFLFIPKVKPREMLHRNHLPVASDINSSRRVHDLCG